MADVVRRLTDVELADLRARVTARGDQLHGAECTCESCFARAVALLDGVPLPAPRKDQKHRRRR